VQAHVTFAIARHAAVDLSQVLKARPSSPPTDCRPEDLEQLRLQLEEAVSADPVRGRPMPGSPRFDAPTSRTSSGSATC